MPISSNKIADLVLFFRDELKNNYESNEIETLIAYCFEEFLYLNRADIVLNKSTSINESELLKFKFAIKSLKEFKPIQYILGKADFYGLKFIVNENVLIPRPETEELVNLIIKEVKEKNKHSENKNGSHFSILDIGTGTGCIPIVLKKNITTANLYALDISLKALEIAKQNAMLHNVIINFLHFDILSPLPSFFLRDSLPIPDFKFDIIVSNPPYICIPEKSQMNKNVLDYEPHLALFVNDIDPMLFNKMIAEFALKYLKTNGELYLEINQYHGLETKQLFESKGFKNTRLLKDCNDNDRILYCNT